MLTHLAGLIDPNTAPNYLEIKLNETATVMYKTVSEEETLYIGNPRTEHKVCQFGLTFRLRDGFMTGSAALNFITNGGWGKGSTKPSFERKSETRNNFMRMLYTACLLNRDDERTSTVSDTLGSELGLPVVPCEWGNLTHEAASTIKEDLSLLGITSAQMLVLQQNNLNVEVDPATVAGRYVNPNYAKAIGGPWDGESMDVAITSALPLGVQRLMEKHGLRFKRVRKESVRTQAQG